MVRWCWVTSGAGASYNLDTVGQWPIALAVGGAGGGCLDIFTLLYPFSPLSPSLWETARYRLKYCLKGPLNPKQPTNQPGRQEVRRWDETEYVCVCRGGEGMKCIKVTPFDVTYPCVDHSV